MRTKKEIHERIRALNHQNNNFILEIEKSSEYSERQTFRHWLAGNLKEIELLKWVLGYEDRYVEGEE